MSAIALRNLWSRKLRTILTTVAIVLGVMMVAGTYVLTDTIDRSFDEIFEESNAGIDAIVTSREVVEQDDGQEPPFGAELLSRVERTDGVAKAAGSISDPQVAIIDPDGDRIGGGGAPTFGLSNLPEPFDPLTYEGRKPEADDEVVIDKQAAETAGYEIGDAVTVAGKEAAGEYQLVGLASLGDVDSFGGASLALFTLPEAQRITGKQGEFDSISVEAADDTSPEQLAANLNQVLPRSVETETGEQNTESQKEDVGEFIGFLKTALLIFAGVALFVAAFLIFNTFSITVAQRTREFAVLRTLGASRRQIIGSVVLEAVVIGFAASVLGLLAGIGFAPALKALFSALEIGLPATGAVIALRTIIVALLLGTLLTLVAALVPAVRATRVSPVIGLREGVVLETPRSHKLRTAAAVALTALGIAAMVLGLFGILDPGEAWVGVGAGAVFLGVALLSPRLVRPLASVVGRPLERLRGVPGRLARENAVRNPGRTAATAAALMIGLALVSFVTVFAAGLRGSIDDAIDKTISGDLILANTDGFSDIPVRTGDAIKDVDGVQTVSPLRYTQEEVKDAGGGYMTLVDPDTVTDVMTLEWEQGSPELLGNLGPNDAVIDEQWGDKNGFGVGDTFVATTASGKKITYTIRGTFKDNADFQGDYVASDVNAAAYGEQQNATNILVKLSEGADVAAAREQIDEIIETQFPTVESQNQEELKDSIGEQLNQLLGVVYGLLFLAVIVSLFGIVNTLALSIYERTRELGLLRAVGMSRRQVRRIVRYESVITALIGAVLGAILGVVFAVIVSRPLADEGFTLTIPFGELIVLLVLAIIAGIVAAIGPARRASRLDVLQALAYE